MLRPAAGQSRLLSDNVSQSSLQDTGFWCCQSPLRDGTFGLGTSRLLFVNQCCWPVLLETRMFCLFFHFHNKKKRPRSVNRPVGVREKTSPRVGLGLWTIISSDEWPHLVKKRETSVSCVCVFFWKKTNKKTPNSMWAAAGTRSPETTKQIQSANSGLLTRLKHSDAGTGLLMLHQDQDPLRHGDKRVIETSTVGSQTYLSCPSLPLSLMRSSQPRPPLGPKPTNSVGWTNTWLALPLMRFTLMSRAADQQTASTLIRPFYTEYTCCLPNTSPKPGTLSIQCCVSTSGRWRYNINVESGAQCFCLHCLNLMWGQLRSQTQMCA